MSGDVRWKRVVVEAAVVIASILLAFGIDAAWGAWQERVAEREAMNALYVEMLGNRQDLAEVIRLNDEASEHFSAFLRLPPDELSSAEGDRWKVDAVWAAYTFDPELGALTLFLERQITTSETGREVRRSAVNWQTLLADAGEESEVLWATSREALGLMTKHISDLVPLEGSEPSLYGILRDYGPRMSRLRADDELLAVSMAKFTLQQIYKNELGHLLDQTDLLLALLEPSVP